MLEFCLIEPLPNDMPPCPVCRGRATGLMNRKVKNDAGEVEQLTWLVMCLNPACMFYASETRCKAAALLAWYIAALRGRGVKAQ